MDNAQASLLDRLIDDDPISSGESAQQRQLDVGRLKAYVVRDLENLLNSRRNIVQLPAEFSELENSVATYGLKDFTAENTASQKVRQTIRKDVERTIARFEPRLRNVKVELGSATKKERNLRFHIAAMLVVDPIREPVVFDTYFDSIRKEYVVNG
jgi:type VI secretion system protein ImpF